MTVRALSLLLWMLLVGCGFHLRGSNVETNIDRAYVRSGSNVDVAARLTQALRQSGVTVLSEADPAVVTIDLLDQREDRRIVSTTARAQAAEYQLDLQVEFQIVGAQGAPLVPQRWAGTSRVVRLDRDNLVGTNQEQALARSEMSAEVVQQILRSLAVATRPGPP